MELNITARRERVQASLFFIPVVFLILGVGLGEAMLWVDRRLDEPALHPTFEATVDGSRAVLTTVATATVTVAGIAFSVALLVFQQASSQFSPRLVGSLFHDSFNKRVIGVVVGTFAYCLIVLRAVRGPGDDGTAVVPALSVTFAVVLGLLTLLAIVAFIDHSAHSIEISELLGRVTDEALEQLEEQGDVDDSLAGGADPAQEPVGAGFVVASAGLGWVQHVNKAKLLGACPAGGTARMHVAPGDHVVEGSTICTIWPGPDDPEGTTVAVRRAVQTGRGRTMAHDPSFGLRQLTDVATKALSPGVNDPTTARDAIFNLTALLRSVLSRPEPAAVHDERGAVLIPTGHLSHTTLVASAYDEIRRDAAARPTVCIYLLQSLADVLAGLPEDAPAAVRGALHRQARLVYQGSAAADPLPEDLRVVEETWLQLAGEQLQGGVPAPGGPTTRPVGP